MGGKPLGLLSAIAVFLFWGVERPRPGLGWWASPWSPGKVPASSQAVFSCLSLLRAPGRHPLLRAFPVCWVKLPKHQAQLPPPTHVWGRSQLLVHGCFPVCEKEDPPALSLDSTLLWGKTGYGFGAPSSSLAPSLHELKTLSNKEAGSAQDACLGSGPRGGFVPLQQVAQTCRARDCPDLLGPLDKAKAIQLVFSEPRSPTLALRHLWVVPFHWDVPQPDSGLVRSPNSVPSPPLLITSLYPASHLRQGLSAP